MCLHNSNSTANTCRSSIFKSREDLATELGLLGDQNSLAALDFASRFQKKVILPYILPIAGVLFVLGGLAMAVWEIGKRGKVVWKHITFVLLATSSSFAVSGAISTSMATGALALFSKAVAGPDVAQGATLQELEWTAVALQLLASGMFMAQARDLSGAKNVMGGNVLSNIGGSGLPL